MIIEFPTTSMAGAPDAKDAAKDSVGTIEQPPDRVSVAEETTTGKYFGDTFVKCHHFKMAIDDKQRTVKCGDCGIWLDPVWCLRLLFWYYGKRIDDRIGELKALEERYQERAKRENERREKPTKQRRRQTRQDHLERAAWNEYEARRLSLRAERQREKARAIDAELGESVTDEVEAAAARARMKSSS